MASKYLCLIHGPSPMVVCDDQKQCGRCVKRTMQMSGKDATKDVCPVVRHFKKPVVQSLKGIRSAYLQVVIVPTKPPKTPEILQENLEKRLKREREVDEIRQKREEHMRGVCKAYELPAPYYYSPFVPHPKWLSDRRVKMEEYLHNVQAVLQSFERHENLSSLEEVKSKENRLYRTTKRAAWRVMYIREAAPLDIDLMPDQNAASAYRDFLRRLDLLAGPRPPTTCEDDCSAAYTTVPRTEGPQRCFSANTYKSKKYALKSYRHQRNHLFSVPYMVKSTVRLNQVVYPRSSNKRNLTIMKHLRTVMILRKLFYHHNQEFQHHFKLKLLEHAVDLSGSELTNRWKRFLSTGSPPEKIKDLLKMASFIAANKGECNVADYCVWDDRSKGPDCLYLPKPGSREPEQTGPKIKELPADA